MRAGVLGAGVERTSVKMKESGVPVNLLFFTTKSKVIVQLTLQTPRTNRFRRALPPPGSRDHLRLAEGGALPYKGAEHCPGFSLQRTSVKMKESGVPVKLLIFVLIQFCFRVPI